MLSWANEPWTVQWDGHDNAGGDGILMKQEYGRLADWKKHFDWMAPYFRHPNYIRNGATGKAQVVIYSPIHASDKGKRMFEAWKVVSNFQCLRLLGGAAISGRSKPPE